MGKVKEIKRTANVAWSPRTIQSIYLAAGTVAQQLDATFSTTACIEIFKLDLGNVELGMPCLGHVETKQRFHKLIWSGYGIANETSPMGVVIGGSDNGNITVWDVNKIINKSDEDPLMVTLQQHVGSVRSLDLNPFQPNLLSSGASESEVFIWDLNNPSSAMSPGTKLHPLEDISGVAWNRQVQHILASTSPSGRSVVWDLRKNEPIIQVSDSNSRIRCKSIAWHPDIATQLVTGSEDDRSPIIQLWDLRYATAPMRTLERHQRGVLSLSWCPQDSDLLLSTAKDNHVYCWNPNTDIPGGEVVYELPATTQWIFECQWCPRNPAIISTSSFDGHISLYSILGGGNDSGQSKGTAAAKVDTSDPFSAISAQQKMSEKETIPLKSPPKWFRRPCGARFGFGGKLVTFTSKDPHNVVVSQVLTEPTFVEQSQAFEAALNQGSFSEFCSQKLSTTAKHHEIWNFLKATFESDFRQHYLNLLGYDPVELSKQVTEWVETAKALPTDYINVDKVTDEVATLPLSDNEDTSASVLFKDSSVNDSDFDNIALEAPPSKEPLSFKLDSDDADGLLTKALLVGNFKAAVDICISADRMSEALILSVAGGSELFQSTQKLFFNKNNTPTTKLISMITSRNWSEIVQYGNLDNWQEILATVVTYASPDDFSRLCDILGERLEEEGKEGCYDNAALCYICSGNVNNFVDCCLKSHEELNDPLLLQDFIEKVTLLRRAVKMKYNKITNDNSLLTDKLSSYVGLLAAQGSLQTALVYLEQTNTQQMNIRILYDRLYQSLGGSGSGSFPFECINVLPPATTAVPSSLTTPTYPNNYRVGQSVSEGLRQEHNLYGGGAYANQYSYPHHQPNVSTMTSTGSVSMFNPSQIPRINAPPINPPFNPLPINNAPPINNTPPINPPFNPLLNNAPPISTAPPTSAPVRVPPISAPPTNTHMTWNDPPTLRNIKKPTKYVAPVPMKAPLAPSHETQPVQIPPLTPPTEANKPGTPTMTQQPPSPVTPIEQQHQPIPSEHVILHTVLNGLLTQCKARANNNIMKRKVDEISRKLEVLYDLVCQSRLSPEVLQGLHAIVYDVQCMNYAGGLARLNHMVATSNMSEITSFMPGIKTLLQLGIQLRV